MSTILYCTTYLVTIGSIIGASVTLIASFGEKMRVTCYPENPLDTQKKEIVLREKLSKVLFAISIVLLFISGVGAYLLNTWK